VERLIAGGCDIDFFGVLSKFEIVLGFVQILVLAALAATLVLTLKNLRLIRTRMRLETRPILRVDLEDYQTATPAQGITLSIITALDQWRSQNPSAVYRYVQSKFSNRQSSSSGTSLNAKIVFRLMFPTVGGSTVEARIVDQLPILEALEASGPLWLAEVGAVPWIQVDVESVNYSDVDGNVYKRTHGTLHSEFQQSQPAIHRYGQLG